MKPVNESILKLKQNVERVIVGKSDTIELVLIALLARGHVLIEDVPGVGKTSLAHTLAASIHQEFRRIQFTNDILPSDITGISIYDQEEKRFHFQKGPLFANIVLADEINRSTPRTQSALLEAMNERQITVDNTTYELEEPFMVIATQNPIESHGAYPLPESQMDRFMMYVSMGYPSLEDERRLLSRPSEHYRPRDVSPILEKEDILHLQKETEEVTIDSSLVDYLLSIVTASRNSKHLSLGVSPRGGLILQQAARARALLHGRRYCIPDDIKRLAVPVLCHRVIPESHNGNYQRRYADTAAIIQDILEGVEIPI